MGKTVIIADSAVDLNSSLRESFGIADYVHGIVVRPDGSQFLADDDWGNMTPEDYFSSMTRGKCLYKSATCSASEVDEVFKKHLAQGEDILGITIGSAFSGMNNLFSASAKRLQPQFPERKIMVVDSCRYSGAYALLCLRAHVAGLGQGQQIGAAGDAHFLEVRPGLPVDLFEAQGVEVLENLEHGQELGDVMAGLGLEQAGIAGQIEEVRLPAAGHDWPA